MTTIYNVFNTKTENEFSDFLNKLSLGPNDLLNIVEIAESYDLDKKAKQQRLLEYMAGTTQKNYDICFDQFKLNFKRVLKEDISQSLNLNQIIELNNLVELIASKLSAPNCMKGIFNIIQSKTSTNIANAFLSMVQQSSVNESNLKFNTDLVIDGKNVAEVIYQIKNEIEMFANSLECPKKEEPKKVSKSLNETFDISNEILSQIKQTISQSSDIASLQMVVPQIDRMIKAYKDTETQNALSALKSEVLTKIASLEKATPKIEECLSSDVMQSVCDDNVINDLVNNVKPTMISITVNQDTDDVCGKEELQDLTKQMAELTINLNNLANTIVSENCSCGATCSASIGNIATTFKPKKKKKKVTEDFELFKDYVSQNIPSSLTINGKEVSYKIIEGKDYLYIDNGILGTTNKQTIMEAIEDIYNDCLEIPVYEGFNHLELDLLLEDDTLNQENPINPAEKEEKEKEIDSQINTHSDLKVNVFDPENSSQSFSDQEMVGVDDSDPDNKQYVVKDPSTGKVRVVPAQNISLQGNM